MTASFVMRFFYIYSVVQLLKILIQAGLWLFCNKIHLNYGFIKNKKWTATLLGISTLILIGAFIGLKSHINSGGIYETKTVGAMIFRISVTFVFAILAYFTITKKKL